jgi:hypothetical protein
MPIERKEWKKQTLTGWICGILAPPFGLLIFCSLYFYGQPIRSLLSSFYEQRVIAHVISLSVLINLVFFFGFLRMNKEYASRGVLGATFLYVFLVLFLKFI